MTGVLVFDGPFQDGEKVRLLRTAKGWRQFDVAVGAGVSPADVSNLERGLPVPKESRKRIFALLGIAEGGADAN